MSPSASTEAISARFGKVVVTVSDRYFIVEPAAAVIVSANSHLKIASGGAHEVTRVISDDYQHACEVLLSDPTVGRLRTDRGRCLVERGEGHDDADE